MGGTLRAATYLDKGGTGKTTSTAHLASALANDGHRVLAIDLASKQGDLATIFGVQDDVDADVQGDDNDDWPNIATTLEENWAAIADVVGGDVVADLVYQTQEGVDLIPAHPDLDGANAMLGNIDDTEERYTRFTRFIEEYVDETDRYDIVLLDLPGAPNHVTYNGLWATRNVIAPVQMGAFEFKQAQALQRDLDVIREDYGVDVTLQMLIPTFYETRVNLDGEMYDEFVGEFGDILAPAKIKKSAQVKRSPAEGRTVFAVAQDDLSRTGEQARDGYLENARELTTRLQNHD